MGNTLWYQVQETLADAGIYFADITKQLREKSTIESLGKQIRELEMQAVVDQEVPGRLECLRSEISDRRRFRQIRMEEFFAACREGN